MACHIIAASTGAGARRVDALAKEEYIKSEENGIWLCYTHGKLIDTDEERYTAEKLKTWREIAVRRARIHQETGKEPLSGWGALERVPLPHDTVVLNEPGAENDAIGNSMIDCAVGIIWGEEFAHAVRDLLVEIARNALIHGGAKLVTIVTEPSRIVISDNGMLHDPLSLPTNAKGRGGARSVRDFLQACSSRAIFAHRYIDGRNEFTIGRAKTPADVKKITPCNVVFKRDRHAMTEKDDAVLASCNVIYLILPPFFSHSDAFNMERCIEQEIKDGKEMVFVANDVSEGVLNVLKERNPGIRSIRL